MSSSATSAASRSPLLRRFGRNRKGSAALEFALVAPVFVALLFAILETGIKFLAGQVLETVTQDAARVIMTGNGQNNYVPYTQAQFASYVCSQVPALLNCGKISIDVEPQASFSSFSTGSDIDNSGNFQNGDNIKYDPGTACQVMKVQLFYPWQLFVTGLGWNPSNLPGNIQRLTATAAFRNEPYGGGTCSAAS